MKKRYKVLFFLAVLVLLGFLLSLNAGKKPKKFEYGATFSPAYAQSLGLDWKQVYTLALSDLGVKRLRISAYWNQVEKSKGQYDFTDLDYQVKEAERYNAKLVLAVGRRLPRWPECHDPEWLKDLDIKEQQNSQLAYVEAVILRYMASPAVEIWQVENEPFLSSFGECPDLDVKFFDTEIALVKKFDPSRPVLISDSGELSLWLSSGKRGDMFGTTLYRYVFSDVFDRYWVNYIPFWFYRVKGGFLRLLNPNKPLVIIELQAEPWTTKGITQTPIDEQFKTMSIQKFESILGVARATGFNPQYLWGIEWWYWMKQQGYPEFWEKFRKLNN